MGRLGPSADHRHSSPLVLPSPGFVHGASGPAYRRTPPMPLRAACSTCGHVFPAVEPGQVLTCPGCLCRVQIGQPKGAGAVPQALPVSAPLTAPPSPRPIPQADPSPTLHPTALKEPPPQARRLLALNKTRLSGQVYVSVSARTVNWP